MLQGAVSAAAAVEKRLRECGDDRIGRGRSKAKVAEAAEGKDAKMLAFAERFSLTELP